MARKAVAPKQDSAATSPPTLESVAAELARLRARVAALEAAQAAPALAIEAAQAPAPPAEAAPLDALSEIHALLRAVFAVALSPETALEGQTRFDRFRDLCHPATKGTPLLDRELLAYKWQPLSIRFAQYLADPQDPGSYRIVQMAPSNIDATTETVKVFLRADLRMPPPLGMRRDPSAGGAFRVDSTSL